MSVHTLSLQANDKPLGLVLSGGGARGAFQVGVWEVLLGDPRGLGHLPHVISGTSAGAINGALIAAGLSPKEMLEFWLELAMRPPVKANRRIFASIERSLLRALTREPTRSLRKRRRSFWILTKVISKHARGWPGSIMAGLLEYMLTARFDNVSRMLDEVQTAYLFSTAPMKKRLAEAIGGTTIKNPRCRLALNTVDVHTGRVVRFVTHLPKAHSESDDLYVHGPISTDMVMASASIPLLFDPVTIGNHELWDGGLLVNTPIAPTMALGAERIIPVMVTAGGVGDRRDRFTLGDAIERLADAFLENAYNTDRKLLLERNKVAELAPERNLTVAELYEPIRPMSSRLFNAGSYLYFDPDALTRMYEAGRAAARAWLRRGPVLDTHPRQERPELVDHEGASRGLNT